MKPHEIYHKVITVFSAVTGLVPAAIKATDDLVTHLHIDYEWDGLILALEEEFSLTIKDEDAEIFVRVIDIISWLNSTINGDGGRNEYGLKTGFIPENYGNLEASVITDDWQYRACVFHDSTHAEGLQCRCKGSWCDVVRDGEPDIIGSVVLNYRVPFDTPIPDESLAVRPLRPKAVTLVNELLRGLRTALTDKLLSIQQSENHIYLSSLGELYPGHPHWGESAESFQWALWSHIQKGDPMDVIAYCAFLWKEGYPTCPPSVAIVKMDDLHSFRDIILNGRGLLAETLDNDQTNAVLHEFDAIFGNISTPNAGGAQ